MLFTFHLYVNNLKISTYGKSKEVCENYFTTWWNYFKKTNLYGPNIGKCFSDIIKQLDNELIIFENIR